jgi:UDP-N-acetylmuramate dehydrogenase
MIYSFDPLLKQLDKSCIILNNEPMKNHTSFKIGGNADLMLIPCCEDDIIKIIKFCKKQAVPLFVMGNGSNLLVSDNGIDGIVLKIGEGLSDITLVGEDKLLAQSGALLSRLSAAALNYSLTGLEFAQGIPGSVGGGVCMNAGAYGGEIAQIAAYTRYIDTNGDIHSIKKEEYEFGYRHSFFTGKDYIVLDTLFVLKKGNALQIKEYMDDIAARRKDKQPVNYPSAGSVFKRPVGYFAGKLIEDCGLKGYCIGGAQVSTKHAGFIINTGNATADDVKKLILHIQNTVRERFNVELCCEIKLVGRD